MGLLQTALRNHARMQILRETHIVGLGIVAVNEPLPNTKGDAVNLYAPTQIPRGYPAVVFH